MQWVHECGNVWIAQVCSRVNGQGCPLCANKARAKGRTNAGLKSKGSVADNYPHLVAEWHSDNTLHPEDVGAGSHTKIHWLCSQGHDWYVGVKVRVAGSNCPICAHRQSSRETSLAVLFPGISAEWHPTKNDVTPDSVFPGTMRKYWWVCSTGTADHDYEASPNARTGADPTGCPKCGNISGGLKYRETHVRKVGSVAETHPHLVAEWHRDNTLSPYEITYGSAEMIRWQCPLDTDHSWTATLQNRGRGSGCSLCAHNKSKGEIDLGNFIETELGFKDLERNNRTIIKPKELDLYIPSLKIAIEYNGVYYHSSGFKEPDDHYEKFLLARALGVKLIHIWEDDWLDHPERVKHLLRHKLGVGGASIGARTLQVIKLAPSQASAFLNAYHMQGVGAGAQEHYGLADGSGIKCVLSINITKKSDIYIVRYASSCPVPGGFSKLLAHVRNLHSDMSVWTHSHYDISDGNLYSSNGFVLEKEYMQEYSYVKYGGSRRESRRNYQKKSFQERSDLKWEPGMTETQLAALNRLLTVHTSGNAKWRLPAAGAKS